MITFAKFLFVIITQVMNIVDRLKRYMDYIGMASTQFADMANIPRPTISQILNGRNRKISNEVIEKLHVGFPNLNIMWLLFGDGEMETRSEIRSAEPPSPWNSYTTSSQPSNGAQFASQPSSAFNNNTTMQSSTIDDFVNATIRQRKMFEENGNSQNSQASMTATKSSDKKIRYIMVFFSDNSFEVLSPI